MASFRVRPNQAPLLKKNSATRSKMIHCPIVYASMRFPNDSDPVSKHAPALLGKPFATRPGRFARGFPLAAG
jgi:hypothetical protein